MSVAEQTFEDQAANIAGCESGVRIFGPLEYNVYCSYRHEFPLCSLAWILQYVTFHRANWCSSFSGSLRSQTVKPRLGPGSVRFVFLIKRSGWLENTLDEPRYLSGIWTCTIISDRAHRLHHCSRWMEHALIYVPSSLQPNNLRNINRAPLLLIVEAPRNQHPEGSSFLRWSERELLVTVLHHETSYLTQEPSETAFKICMFHMFKMNPDIFLYFYWKARLNLYRQGWVYMSYISVISSWPLIKCVRGCTTGAIQQVRQLVVHQTTQTNGG